MEALRPKKTLVEKTYEALVDAICTGELSPGVRLNQEDLAAKLNVSRQPVNSAIMILKTNHLVEETGRRGVVVSPINPGIQRSIDEFRMLVEPFAVRLATKRMPQGAEVTMADIIRRGRHAASAHSISELVRADQDFHQLVYEWSGNHVLQSSMRQNWPHIRRSMSEVLKHVDHVAPIWGEHEEIFRLMQVGETDRAASLMEQHLRQAAKS